MKHVFKATKMGWDKEKEGVWFDADSYSEEEAKAQFKEFKGTTQRGYPYNIMNSHLLNYEWIGRCTETKDYYLFAIYPKRWDGKGDPPSSGIMGGVRKDGHCKLIPWMDAIDIILSDLPSEPKEINIQEL